MGNDSAGAFVLSMFVVGALPTWRHSAWGLTGGYSPNMPER